MKKVIFGGMLMLAGLISASIFMIGTLVAAAIEMFPVHVPIPPSVAGSGLMFRPSIFIVPLVMFIIIFVIGLVVSLRGLFEKRKGE